MTLETIAFTGTVLVALAYVPQVFHLLSKHCAYGISVNAWAIWLVATLLILPHTVAVGDPVFIFLISTHAIAISCILIFSYFHQGRICNKHKLL